MLPVIEKEITLYRYVGNPQVQSHIEEEIEYGGENLDGIFTVIADFADDEGNITSKNFNVSLFDHKLQTFYSKENSYTQIENWFIMSEFAVNVDDWFPEIEGHLEEHKLPILIKKDNGPELLEKAENLAEKRGNIYFSINGVIFNLDYSQKVKDFAEVLIEKKKSILGLKNDIQKHLDVKLSKKKISEETHNSYLSMLERFYFWLLSRRTMEFPEVTSKAVEEFKMDSQEGVYLGYYSQGKFSMGYVNQIINNVVDFVENYQKKDIGVIELFKIPPRTREVYGEEIHSVDETFIYMVTKYQSLLERRTGATMSRFRDKMRNLILFRLSLETLMTNRDLSKLTFSNINDDWNLVVNGRVIYLTNDTKQFLKQYVSFRKSNDERILKGKIEKMDVLKFYRSFRELLDNEDVEEIVAVETRMEELEELFKKDEKEESLREEYRELSKLKMEKVEELNSQSSTLIKKMIQKPLFQHLFISNRYRIPTINTMEKILKEVGVNGMNLSYTREKRLAEVGIHPYIVDKMRIHRKPKLDIKITPEIIETICDNMTVIKNDQELTKRFKEKIISDGVFSRTEYVRYTLRKTPKPDKYREELEKELENYKFQRHRLMQVRPEMIENIM